MIRLSSSSRVMTARAVSLVLSLMPAARCGAEAASLLAPAAGFDGVTVPEGIVMKVWADHARHGVTAPTALAFGPTGSMWVAETHRFRQGVEDNRDHLYWYLDDLAARTVADRRALHEKWDGRVPIGKLTAKSEVVRWLADGDGDGAADQSKVYADEFRDVLDGTAAGVFEWDGTVYFACIPKLWMLRDKDGDGVADERLVAEQGFGVRVSFSGHDMNGFAMGPDGRVYGTIGDRGFSLTTKEGHVYQYPGQGAVFRFEPDGSRFEVVHTGLRNPKEIAFDELGNAVTVDNNSDQGDRARIVQVVEGADSGWEYENQTMHSFHREIGLPEMPVNRWMAERMWEPANREQPAYLLPPLANLASGPSGLAYHPGSGFLDSERGRFLLCDYRGGAAISGLWSFRLETAGAGLRLADARPLLWGVAATDVDYAPDGRVAVADFIGGWTTHQGGRILTVGRADGRNDPDGVAAILAAGFGKASDRELVERLDHPDQRVRLRAQLALCGREAAGKSLREAFGAGGRMARLHAVWGIGILARKAMADEETLAVLQEAVADEDAELRAQAVRVIGDAGIGVEDDFLGDWLEDPSPRVRAQAALTAGKTKARGVLGAVLRLIERDGAADPVLRHAGVFALERLASPEEILALLGNPGAETRLAAVVALRRLRDARVAAFVADEDRRVSDEAVRAIHDLALEEGRPAVAALLDDFRPGGASAARPEMMMRRLMGSAFRLGGEENARRLLAVAENPRVEERVRLEAIRLLGHWGQPPPVDQVTGHWRPLPERGADEAVGLVAAAGTRLLESGDSLLAAWIGTIRRLGIGRSLLGDEGLLRVLERVDAPALARAGVLEMLSDRGLAEEGDFLARWSLGDCDEVAVAAMRRLVEKDPARAVGVLRAAKDKGGVARRQAAWGLLGGLPGAEAAGIVAKGVEETLEAGGVSPVAIEILESAERRTESEVKSAMETWLRRSGASLAGRMRWMPALEGGDPARGLALFQSHPAAQCTRCHSLGGGHALAGGDVGPDLAGVGLRGDRRFLLESLLEPSAKVAAGYGAVVLRVRDGATVAGRLVEESERHSVVQTAEGLWRVEQGDVAERVGTSAMPPMGSLLTAREIRDLVAWLASLQEKVPGRQVAAGEQVRDYVVKTVEAGTGQGVQSSSTPAASGSSAMVAEIPWPESPAGGLPTWAWWALALWFGMALRNLTRKVG